MEVKLNFSCFCLEDDDGRLRMCGPSHQMAYEIRHCSLRPIQLRAGPYNYTTAIDDVAAFSADIS